MVSTDLFLSKFDIPKRSLKDHSVVLLLMEQK